MLFSTSKKLKAHNNFNDINSKNVQLRLNLYTGFVFLAFLSTFSTELRSNEIRPQQEDSAEIESVDNTSTTTTTDTSSSSVLYDKDSDAYKLAEIDNYGELSASDYDKYKKYQSLLSEVTSSFKYDPNIKASISDITVNGKIKLKEKTGKDVTVLELLEGAASLNKNNAALISYAEYMAAIVTLTTH